MLIGTTVAAGVVCKMHSEPVGRYAVETKIEEINQGETGENSSASGQTQEVFDIKDVRMEVSYLPEGMADTGDAQFDMLTTGRNCRKRLVRRGN